MIWLIFHSADLDGHLSGALLRWCHERQGLKKDVDFKLLGYNYGEPFDETQIKDGDKVIFADVLLQPYERLEALNKRCDLSVYDHHKSPLETLKKLNIKGVYEVGKRSACEIVWTEFIDKHKVAEFVKLLSDYDNWNNEDEEYWTRRVFPFQMGMRAKQTRPDIDEGYLYWMQDWCNGYSGVSVPKVVREGEAIITYTTQYNKDMMERSFDMQFEGLKLLVVNGFKGSPQFDSKWDRNKYDAMMSFYNVGNKNWTISMYTDKEIDLSEIAKKYGGGGHPKACGFQVDDITKIIGPTSSTTEKKGFVKYGEGKKGNSTENV